MWQALFGLTNLVALLGWIALAVLPRKPLVLDGVLWLGVGLLCSVYALFLGLIVSGAVDPMALPGGGAASFSTIEGVRGIFLSDGGVVVGWTHYLAFDLFTGRWIARDADARKVNRVVQVPFLFATFMAGPVGLLSWLVLRRVLGAGKPEAIG